MVKLGERESKKLFETHDYDMSAAAGLLLLRLLFLLLLPFHSRQRVATVYFNV